MKRILTLLSFCLLIFGELTLPAIQIFIDCDIHIESTSSEKEQKSEKEIENIDAEYIFVATSIPSQRYSVYFNALLEYNHFFGDRLNKGVVSPPPDQV